MAGLSRRKALVSGGALGALGALTVAAPATARTLWTWSPRGSVAGSGAGVDPRRVWDPAADPVVASLLDDGAVPRVNELLRQWTTNDQPLPAGLPAELRDFIEQARRLPDWADHDKLAQAFDFTKRRGLYLGVLYGMASGMMSTVIPREARAVYYSYGGPSDTKVQQVLGRVNTGGRIQCLPRSTRVLMRDASRSPQGHRVPGGDRSVLLDVLASRERHDHTKHRINHER